MLNQDFFGLRSCFLSRFDRTQSKQSGKALQAKEALARMILGSPITPNKV